MACPLEACYISVTLPVSVRSCEVAVRFHQDRQTWPGAVELPEFLVLGDLVLPRAFHSQQDDTVRRSELAQASRLQMSRRSRPRFEPLNEDKPSKSTKKGSYQD